MDEQETTVERARPYALYPLRIGIAIIFILAGWNKITGFSGWEQALVDLGFPLATTLAVLVIIGELFGGIGVLLGVLTRFSAAVHSLIMVAALLTVRIFGSSPAGWELDVALLAGSITLVINGPGRPTVTSALGWEVDDPEQWLWDRLTARIGSDPSPASAA